MIKLLIMNCFSFHFFPSQYEHACLEVETAILAFIEQLFKKISTETAVSMSEIFESNFFIFGKY